VRLYPGNYSIYLEYKKDEAEMASSEAKEQSNKAVKEQKAAIVPTIANETQKAKAEPKAEKKKNTKVSFKEKREYEELEVKIPQLETEKSQVEKTLYHNPPTGHTELKKLSDRLAELNQAIEQSTERWLELAERI
jgi:ATP-binding cassette subfamily F protein uup